jgi:2'-5' RNA ligase
MRLFLGIDLPIELKERIHNYLLPLQESSKGWESLWDYHLTLKFIGEVDNENKEAIIKELKKFSFRPFLLSLDQVHFFNRRIMYMGLRPSQELEECKQSVSLAFSQWGEAQEKPFIPHITVKRWQRYEYESLVEGLRHRPFLGGAFLVDSLILFKSEKCFPDRKYQIVEIHKF